MTSIRQIEANRRNARLSTGPVTEEGKRRSRLNAVRHGLTAETVIDALEDAEDYAAFELAVTSDYDAQTAVERELVLRLASLLWRPVGPPQLKAACSRSRRNTCFCSGNGDEAQRITEELSTECTRMPSRMRMDSDRTNSPPALRRVQRRPRRSLIPTTT
jgi:hypothetical protein